MFYPSLFAFACGALRLNIDDIMIANPDLNILANDEDIPQWLKKMEADKLNPGENQVEEAALKEEPVKVSARPGAVSRGFSFACRRSRQGLPE